MALKTLFKGVSSRNNQRRRFVHVSLCLLLFLGLLAAFGHAKTPAKKSQTVTLTQADGSSREVSLEEMERLVAEQQAKHAEMGIDAPQQPPPHQHQHEEEEEDDNAFAPQTASLDEIQRQDPEFAAEIALSRRIFDELKRTSYANGLELTGFSPNQQKTNANENELHWLLTANEPTSQEEVKYDVKVRLDRQRGEFVLLHAARLTDRDGQMRRVTLQVDAQRRISVATGKVSSQPASSLPQASKKKPSSAASTPAKATSSGWLNADQMGFVMLLSGAGLIGCGLVIILLSRTPSTPTSTIASSSSSSKRGSSGGEPAANDPNWELEPKKDK